MKQEQKAWLTGDTVTLHPTTRAEHAEIRLWLEDASTVEWLNLDDPMLPERQLPEFPVRVDSAYLTKAKPQKRPFSVVRRKDGRLIGAVLLNISFVYSTATIRTIIEPQSRGQHFGFEAKRLVLEYAFECLRLERVCSFVLEHNIASIRINEHLGFRQEGILRSHASVRGTRRNLLCMGILRTEWELKNDNIESKSGATR